MDWREFVSTLVGDLAWPLVALAALVTFKKQISIWVAELLRKDSGRLKLWGAEMQFDRVLRELDRDPVIARAEQADVGSETAPLTEAEPTEDLELADSPISEHAGDKVLTELRNKLINDGVDPAVADALSFDATVALAGKRGLIDPSITPALYRLSRATSLLAAVVNPPITREQAATFARVAQAALRVLK